MMKKSGIWTVPMAAMLALSLVGCGEKAARDEENAGKDVGQGVGDVMQDVEQGVGDMVEDVEQGVNNVRAGMERRMAQNLGSRDLAGADGIVGSPDPSTTVNPASTAYDSTQGRPTGDAMKRMGDGIKNTLDDMGKNAENLARDVKHSME